MRATRQQSFNVGSLSTPSKLLTNSIVCRSEFVPILPACYYCLQRRANQ